MRVHVAHTHPLGRFATGKPTYRNFQELWVTLLPPGCACRDSVRGLQMENTPQTLLAIFPINQEDVLGSACLQSSPGCEENHSHSTPSLAEPACSACGGSLGVRGWGLAPCTSSNYSTLILAHLWPMKSRPNFGVCGGGEEMEAGPKLP